MKLFETHNRWLAIQVIGGRELTTAASITRRGYENLVPVYVKRRSHNHVTNAPLFPGYVFVRFNAENTFPIVTVPGVIRFVGIGAHPVPIDDHEIEALHILGRTRTQCSPCAFIENGQTIAICKGVLTGLNGTVVRWKNKYRLVVSIKLLKQSVLVELDQNDVVPLMTSSAATFGSAA
jgi:transcription antitermination factor NusG